LAYSSNLQASEAFFFNHDTGFYVHIGPALLSIDKKPWLEMAQLPGLTFLFCFHSSQLASWLIMPLTLVERIIPHGKMKEALL
jgi:hypothetical protein